MADSKYFAGDKYFRTTRFAREHVCCSDVCIGLKFVGVATIDIARNNGCSAFNAHGQAQGWLHIVADAVKSFDERSRQADCPCGIVVACSRDTQKNS